MQCGNNIISSVRVMHQIHLLSLDLAKGKLPPVPVFSGISCVFAYSRYSDPYLTRQSRYTMIGIKFVIIETMLGLNAQSLWESFYASEAVKSPEEPESPDATATAETKAPVKETSSPKRSNSFRPQRWKCPLEDIRYGLLGAVPLQRHVTH